MAKKSNGCMGCLTLCTMIIVSLLAYVELSFNWWQSLLVGFVSQVVVAGIVKTILGNHGRGRRHSKKERHPRELHAPINATPLIHALYEAANLLNEGFPIMRVSKDETPSSCPICSKWEGALINLSNEPLLEGATHSLRELMESGIFHEDCIHRLEYVSLDEYPPLLLRKLKGRVGNPGEFGHISVSDIRCFAKLNKDAIKREERKCAKRFLRVGVFTCSACSMEKPVEELFAIDGELNFCDEDFSLICEACERDANKKGKTFIRHPIYEKTRR